MRKHVFNQPIDILSMDEASHLAKMALVNCRQFRITTLNSEMVVNATKNIEFQAAINNSNLVVPDGAGIVLASKFLGIETKNIKRIPGIELTERILHAANELKKNIAIFGGKKEILEKVVEAFNGLYPKLTIVKAIDGYKKLEEHAEVAKTIAISNPNLILVALGSPKQEIWINKFASLFPKSVIIGIGGSLDIWANKKTRAPVWVRNINLEWLYRAITEPARIPRILKTLPQFAWMVLKAKLTN